MSGEPSKPRGEPSKPPGLDCIVWGHILVENTEEGAWETYDEGALPYASWCLYCGSGVSNEKVPGQE